MRIRILLSVGLLALSLPTALAQFSQDGQGRPTFKSKPNWPSTPSPTQSVTLVTTADLRAQSATKADTATVAANQRAATAGLLTKVTALTAATYAQAVALCAALPAGVGASIKVLADESPGNAGTGAGGTNPTSYYDYWPGEGFRQKLYYPTN